MESVGNTAICHPSAECGGSGSLENIGTRVCCEAFYGTNSKELDYPRKELLTLSTIAMDVLHHIVLFGTVDDLIDLMMTSRYFESKLHPKVTPFLIPQMLWNEVNQLNPIESKAINVKFGDVYCKWKNAASAAWNNCDVTPFQNLIDPLPLKATATVSDHESAALKSTYFVLHFIMKCRYWKQMEINELLCQLVSLDREYNEYCSYLGLSTMMYCYFNQALVVAPWVPDRFRTQRANVLEIVITCGVFVEFVGHFVYLYQTYHKKNETYDKVSTVMGNMYLFESIYHDLFSLLLKWDQTQLYKHCFVEVYDEARNVDVLFPNMGYVSLVFNNNNK